MYFVGKIFLKLHFFCFVYRSLDESWQHEPAYFSQLSFSASIHFSTILLSIDFFTPTPVFTTTRVLTISIHSTLGGWMCGAHILNQTKYIQNTKWNEMAEKSLLLTQFLNKTQQHEESDHAIKIFNENIESFIPHTLFNYSPVASAIFLSILCFFMILWLFYAFKDNIFSKFR